MATSTALKTADSSPSNRQRVDFDNLIRRELKVGDPNDPEQIARALAARYQGDARAQAIDAEARGLPFLNTPSLTMPTVTAPTATNLDLEQARDDVNKDLNALLTSNLTKDVRPELEGWQQAITGMIDEGVSAAGQGLDAYSRDRAFAMRRQLGEYARLARLIGALTPELNENYRNLAQSLDEVCAVLLVLMGESMANAGFAGGRYLLQVPFSELQSRRDAVLIALRNLSGGAQAALTQSTWPRGLDAYRRIYNLLEEHGQTELRSLLSESELAHAMDELIQAAGGGSTTGMRRVGATAWGPINRFQRFVQITSSEETLRSPALAGFQEALQLFTDGFENAGGFRLLRIARPSVLLYGLYGSTQLTPADRRLVELVSRRGALASLIDCVTRCACDIKLVKAQIVLDTILFNVDRAIDLYAIGEKDFGVPEQRAAACGLQIYAAQNPASWAAATRPNPDYLGSFNSMGLSIDEQLTKLQLLLIPQTDSLWDSPDFVSQRFLSDKVDLRRTVGRELALQIKTDMQWRPIVAQMASGCVPLSAVFNGLDGLPHTALDYRNLGCLTAFQYGALRLVDDGTTDYLAPPLSIPNDTDTSWDVMAKQNQKTQGTLSGILGKLDQGDRIDSLVERLGITEQQLLKLAEQLADAQHIQHSSIAGTDPKNTPKK
jgi:hypothetical protein